MPVVLGNTVGLYVNNQLIGCLTTNAFNSTTAEIETTCKDQNGAYTFRFGSNTAEFPFEANFNPASGYGLEDLIQAHKNETLLGVKQLDTESGFFIAAYGYIPTLNWTGPLNASSVFSGTIKVSGAWTYGTET